MMRGVNNSTHGPTAMHRQSLQIAESDILALRNKLDQWNQSAGRLRQALHAAGAPWVKE
ncbi:MAG: hypothetical protein R2795_09290 [Saprospiraceae bacterium]